MTISSVSGIVGSVLANTMLVYLVRKRVFLDSEAAEIIEQSLLLLEGYQAKAPESDQEDFEGARMALEVLRKSYSLSG